MLFGTYLSFLLFVDTLTQQQCGSVKRVLDLGLLSFYLLALNVLSSGHISLDFIFLFFKHGFFFLTPASLSG